MTPALRTRVVWHASTPLWRHRTFVHMASLHLGGCAIWASRGFSNLTTDRFFIYGPEPTGIWTGFDNRPEIRFGIRPGGVFKLDTRPEIGFEV